MENRENVNVVEVENMENVENVNVVECEYCGEEINLEEEEVHSTSDYECVCNNCLENNYSYCEDCCENVPNDDMVVVDRGYRTEMYVCDECAENNYYRCDSCDDYFTIDNVHCDYDTCICDSCFNRYNYARCDGCDEIFSDGRYSYSESDDAYYCHSCYESHRSRVGDWHDHKGEFDKQRLSDEEYDITYYGVEYEMVHKESTKDYENELLDTMENTFPCVFERDGSLDYSGVEVITQPMSWNYIQSIKENIKSGFNKAIDLGYRSDEFSCCGQHIHVSRPDDEVIDRIEFILETYKDEFIAFARRHNEHYAKFLSDKFTSNYDKERLSSIEYIKKTKDSYDRYMVLNLTNSDTIEFRLFKGTLRFETCMANLELVHNLMELCGNLELPLEKITWSELTKGEFIEQYVNERGITTDKIPTDRTLEFVEKDNATKEIIRGIMNKVKDMVLDLYNENASKVIQLKEYDSNMLREIRNNARQIHKLCGDICEDLDSIESFLSNGQLGYAINRLKDSIRYRLTDFVPYSSVEKFENELISIEL